MIGSNTISILNAGSGIKPNIPCFFRVISLFTSHNKQPPTYSLLCRTWTLFQALCVLREVRTECHVDLLVFNASMILAPPPSY